MANKKNTGTNFEKTQVTHSFPNYGTTADDISVSVPVTFTPTDAARLSKRYDIMHISIWQWLLLRNLTLHW